MTSPGPLDRRASRTFRRVDPYAYIVGAAFGPVLPAAVIVDLAWRPQPTYALAFSAVLSAGGLVTAYLAGPAASVIVAPDTVAVVNPLVRYDVPRHLAEGFNVMDTLSVGLRVRGHRPIEVRALLPGLATTPSRRALSRDLDRLERYLDEVPRLPSHGEVLRSRRTLNIAMLATAVIGFAGSLALATSLGLFT